MEMLPQETPLAMQRIKNRDIEGARIYTCA